MKRIWISLCFLGVLAGCGKADQGAMDGGGGDPNVAEFKSLGRAVVNSISSLDFAQADVQRLSRSVEKTAVEFKSSVVVNGVERAAANYPSKNLIEVCVGRWGTFDREQKAKLVFHEHLGLLGISDQDYGLSSRLALHDSEDDCGDVAGCPHYKMECVVTLKDKTVFKNQSPDSHMWNAKSTKAVLNGQAHNALLGKAPWAGRYSGPSRSGV